MRILAASIALAICLSFHAAPARAASDGGWPRSSDTASGARITLYQPQVASWPDQKHMTLYAAVAYLAPGAIPREQRVIWLDRVMATVDTSLISPKHVQDLKAGPPQIFVSQTPAVLVNLDGDPISSPTAQNDLEFAVNTDEQILRVGDLYYMCYEGVWFVGNAPSGAWQVADSIPQAIYQRTFDASRVIGAGAGSYRPSSRSIGGGGRSVGGGGFRGFRGGSGRG